MVKRGSSTFSAASVAKGSVVLSRAVEKNFALEAEVSRLRHHISVLSRRLHFITLERDGLVDMVAPTMFVEEKWGETPLTDEEVAGEEERSEAAPSVAGSGCPSVAMVEGAGEEAEVAEEMAVEKASLSVAGVGVEERHDVAGRGDVKEAESAVAEEAVDIDTWMERRMVRDRERLAERKERREENTAGEVGVVERVPEMAENCNRFKMDLVGREVSPLPDSVVMESLKSLRTVALDVWRQRGLLRERMEVEEAGLRREMEGVLEGRLVSSGDEDAIIGGVIVAGGASQKAKNAARKKKRKIRRGEASGRGGGG